MMAKYMGLLIFLFTYGWIVIRSIQTENVFLITISTLFFVLGIFFSVRSIIKKNKRESNKK